MGIFFNSNFSDGYSDDLSNIEGTAECGMRIAYESYADINKLIAGIYIADTMADNAVFEGRYDFEQARSLMENAVSDFFGKVKEKLIELKNKIIKWFNEVKDRVYSFFADVAKFVDKYEDEIKRRASNAKFTYEGYSYKGDGAISSTKNAINELKNEFNKFDKATSKDAIEKADEKLKNVDKFKEQIATATRDKSKHSIKFKASDADNMIKFIKKYNDHKDEVQNNTHDVIKTIDAAIDKCNELNSGKNISDSDKGINHAKVNLGTKCVNYMQTLNSYGLGLLKEQYRQYGAVLKKVFRTGGKPAKESYDYYDSYDSGDNLLESAMELM